MSYRKAKSTGFTLVEILIVVVILGILAAIVIPQFSSASDSAKASQLKAQIQTIRSQLELAQIEHQGEYPVLVGVDQAGWSNLLNETGRLSGATPGAYPPYDVSVHTQGKAGPYLQKPPGNAFYNGGNPTSIGTNSSAWIYNQATGFIAANCNALDNAKAGTLGLDVMTSNTVFDGDVFTSEITP